MKWFKRRCNPMCRQPGGVYATFQITTCPRRPMPSWRWRWCRMGPLHQEGACYARSRAYGVLGICAAFSFLPHDVQRAAARRYHGDTPLAARSSRCCLARRPRPSRFRSRWRCRRCCLATAVSCPLEPTALTWPLCCVYRCYRVPCAQQPSCTTKGGAPRLLPS